MTISSALLKRADKQAGSHTENESIPQLAGSQETHLVITLHYATLKLKLEGKSYSNHRSNRFSNIDPDLHCQEGLFHLDVIAITDFVDGSGINGRAMTLS